MSTVLEALDFTKISEFNSMVGEVSGQLGYMFHTTSYIELEFLGEFAATIRVIPEEQHATEAMFTTMLSELDSLLDVLDNDFTANKHIDREDTMCLEIMLSYEPFWRNK